MKLNTVFTFMAGWIIFFVVTCVPAWFTHIIVCLRIEEYLLLIAGAILFPIAVFHGWYVWIMWLWNLFTGFF